MEETTISINISVIIVNYNTSKLLKQCLESLYSNTKDVKFEVIVVDNNSQDDSVNMVKTDYPSVVLVEPGENLGFGRANNLGAEMARGKYLFLLNSDTIVNNNALSIFYDFMENHGGVGAVGCWLKDVNECPNRSYGYFPSILTEIEYIIDKIKERIGFRSAKECDKCKRVDYIMGADLFVRSSLFRQLGGFDPYFFMYYEETDLQYRMKAAGFERVVISGPDIVHLDGGSFSSNGLTPNRFKMSQKSFNYYAQKNYSFIHWLVFRLFIIIWRASMLLTLKKWPLKERWEGYKLVLLNTQ